MMLKSSLLTVLQLLLLARMAVAGCTTRSFTTCADRIVHWYDPTTGEICDPLDCGGGRAPPKTDVPGCPLYSGTATRPTSPSYLPCFTPVSSVERISATPIITTERGTTAIIGLSLTTTNVAMATETGTTTSVKESAHSTSTQSNAPLTTPPASLPAQSTASSTTPPTTSTTVPSLITSVSLSITSGHNGTASNAATSAPALATPNGGSVLEGSLMAAAGAGAAVGIIAFVF